MYIPTKTPKSQWCIVWLHELCLGHSKDVGPVNITSGHIYLPHWPSMAIQYQYDTFRDIIYRNFGPTMPPWPLTLKNTYLGFISSALGHPKHVGPVNITSGLIYLHHRPATAMKYQCDTICDVIYCNFGGRQLGKRTSSSPWNHQLELWKSRQKR